MSQPISKQQLKQHRRHLQRQRRHRSIQSLWRFSCMSGIFAGSIWAICQIDWTISKPEQVRIEGNQYLSDTTIRSMLAISYPKSIVELGTEQLTTRSIERGFAIDARIDRGLFPPHLTVQIQDFPPVARLVRDPTSESQLYIDERGLELPLASYRHSVSQSLPTLQLRLPAQGACPQWVQLYRAVRTSPVAIGVIDCRDPQNLSLQTEIGKIRLGAIGDLARLTSQIQQLDRLRDWQKLTRDRDVDGLDLENPDFPKLQLKQPVTVPAKLDLKPDRP
ncbi:FtsQ-type POTRA domain-containing protein [Chamaesiphon sp. OTE_75_metabat_556]|uniref:cell division protein FtsQ/DivIB n=1 Tax=Chamaesiphon sp. OTE_75_metabat_556 TaxID=2964692 RepID=UPI00286A5780|nr:FtsQ-type POTRA domain-containing protein [Chamaesiphon sp. OTE_75_metabat_556]